MNYQAYNQASQVDVDVRIASYNLLNEITVNNENNEAHLDEQVRWERIIKKISAQMRARSIICLQEITEEWIGLLQAHFLKRGYHFITGQYSYHMSVGIAYPVSEYDIIACDVKTASDTKRPKFSSMETSSSGVWRDARKKTNKIVAVRLRPRENHTTSKATPASILAGAAEFCVGTYHMPCAYMNTPLMLIHCTLVAKYMENFARHTPYLLAGDFNSTPDSAMYELLTRGHVTDKSVLPPKEWEGDKWAVGVAPMRSAYRAVLGREPNFTNFNFTETIQPHSKESIVKPLCLDYIFYHGFNWEVKHVMQLPKLGANMYGEDQDDQYEHEREVLKSLRDTEASDHLMLAAHLVLHCYL